MADSLLDFGNIAQLAQNNLRNAMQMHQMGMQEENLQLHREQQKINQQNANTEYINTLGNFLKDERVKYDPNLEGHIINTISRVAGGPDVDMRAIQVGRQSKVDYANGILTGNANLAKQGALGVVATLPMDQLDNFVNSTKQYEKLHEEVLAMKQAREENAGKFEQLQYNNARVTLGRPQYTAMASSFNETLAVTKSADYKNMQRLYGKIKDTGGDFKKLLGSSPVPGVDKSALANLLNGKFGESARLVEGTVANLRQEIEKDQRMLDEYGKGIPVPTGESAAVLRARIETNGVVAGAYNSLKEWYEEPFDKAKHDEAHNAARTIEAQRLKIEELDKNTHADTIRIQQETLASHQEKEQFKREQDAADAQAKAMFAALPTKRQTPQEAEKIYKSVLESTGKSVAVDDIMKGIKNPNAPSSVTEVNLVQEKAFDQELGKENAKDIKETRIKARDAVEIIDTIHQGRKLLDSGVITGVGAEYLTTFGQALSQAGFTESEDKVANTRAYASLMANNVGKLIKQFGSGTGLSDSDRKYAERMAAGDITIGEPSIRKIMDMSERAARNVITRHNESVKGVKSMVPLTVDAPPEYAPSKQPSASPSGKAAPNATQPAPAPYKDQGKEERYQKWLKEHPEFQ